MPYLARVCSSGTILFIWSLALGQWPHHYHARLISLFELTTSEQSVLPHPPTYLWPPVYSITCISYIFQLCFVHYFMNIWTALAFWPHSCSFVAFLTVYTYAYILFVRGPSGSRISVWS